METRQVLSAGEPTTPAVRDRALVAFVARHGAVAIGHVMAAMGVGRTAAYRRVAVLGDAGLLERRSLLRGEPALILATRAGLRYAGLGALGVAVVRPGGADHWLRCADVALRLEEEFGAGGHVLAERELMLAERVERRPLASARLSSHGRDALHRPDLAVFADAGHPLIASPPTPARPLAAHPRTRERRREIAGRDGRAAAGAEEMGLGVIAVEVELSVKAPRRLEQIVRAWRRAEHVGEVRYLCGSAAVVRAVERAVAATYAAEKVRIEELP